MKTFLLIRRTYKKRFYLLEARKQNMSNGYPNVFVEKPELFI